LVAGVVVIMMTGMFQAARFSRSVRHTATLSRSGRSASSTMMSGRTAGAWSSSSRPVNTKWTR